MYIRTEDRIQKRHIKDGTSEVVFESMLLDASLPALRQLHAATREVQRHAASKEMEKKPRDLDCRLFRRIRMYNPDGEYDWGGVGDLVPAGMDPVGKDEALLRFSATGPIHLVVSESGAPARAPLFSRGYISLLAILQCLLLQAAGDERQQIIADMASRNPIRLLLALEKAVKVDPKSTGAVETNVMSVVNEIELVPLLQSHYHEVRVRARLLLGADRTSKLSVPAQLHLPAKKR